MILPLHRRGRSSSSSSDKNKTESLVQQAFEEIVESSDFLVIPEHENKGVSSSATNASASSSTIACRVPAFGEDASVSLTPQQGEDPRPSHKDHDNYHDHFILQVDGSSVTDTEFGWICAKFYECRDSFGGTLDLTALRSVVTEHFNELPPHPGYTPTVQGSPTLQATLARPDVLHQLEQQGYVVLDNVLPKTNDRQHEQLSEYLHEKTNQGSNVRRDTVHFVSQAEAQACGMQDHFHELMAIATHLNDLQDDHLRSSPNNAVRPATLEQPLTVPKSIQLAEYGKDDFYIAHSDNSLDIAVANVDTDAKIADDESGLLRNNFRHYTCILYLNSHWTADMGGALRIYLNSREYLYPKEAAEECDHVDILPENGRLLLFDSCLVHAVQRVKQAEQTRRALTLWIKRPNDSGVRGEKFF